MDEKNQNTNNNTDEVSLEGEIERANIRVSLARGREDLDEALRLVTDLIKKAPNERKVYEIAKRLAIKDQGVLRQLKRLYKAYGVDSFMEEQADRFDHKMREAVESGNTEAARDIYEQAKSAGLASPVTDEIFERGQAQQQRVQQGIVVPREIEVSLMRSQSTYRAGDYEKCIDLCTDGLDLLEKLHPQMNLESYEYTHKRLIAQLDQAQFKLDRKIVLFRGIELINQGKWRDARNLFHDSLESFTDDELFEDELEKLEEALESENELDRQSSQLRSEPEDTEKLLELHQKLVDLPSRVSASSSPTERQKRILQSLQDIKRSMISRFKTVGSRNLELSKTANSDADKREMLIEARKHLQLVEQLDNNDPEASKMLQDIIRSIQKIEAEEIKSTRSRKLLRLITIAASVILLLIVIGFAGRLLLRSIEERELHSAETAIAQQNSTGTAVVNIAVLTADASSTSLAVQQTLDWQTQEAQNTISANTAIARTTDIALTANARTAEAQQTQRSIEFSVLTATQSSVQAQNEFRQTQIAETATISALMTQTANAPTPIPTATLTLTPTATPLYRCQGVVTITQGVNVRERPSVNSPDVGTVLNAALVEIYNFRESNNSNIDGWYQIVFSTETGASQGGWIASNYVAPIGCPDDWGD